MLQQKVVFARIMAYDFTANFVTALGVVFPHKLYSLPQYDCFIQLCFFKKKVVLIGYVFVL